MWPKVKGDKSVIDKLGSVPPFLPPRDALLTRRVEQLYILLTPQ